MFSKLLFYMAKFCYVFNFSKFYEMVAKNLLKNRNCNIFLIILCTYYYVEFRNI